MSTNELDLLVNQVKTLGFPERIAEEAGYYIKANVPTFHLYYHKEVEEDQLMYDLRSLKQREGYQLTQYELTLKEVIIPNLNIHGISTNDLDKKLKEVDGWYDKFLNPETESRMSKQEYDNVIGFITSTNNELYRLAEFSEGEETARLLMFKYFPQSEYEKFFQGYDEVQKIYEHKRMFPVNEHTALSAVETYQLLKNEISGVQPSVSRNAIERHIISDEVLQQFSLEIPKGNQWIAYNTVPYHLEKHDLYFFNTRDEANDFAESNRTEFDNYRVINGKELSKRLSELLPNETILFTPKTNFMNQKNFEYLRDQVKFTGFGEGLENELREKMQKQTPEFQLTHNTKFGNDDVKAALHFKKSDQTDMYFFNRYQVSLMPEGSKDRMEQTFYINKEGSITLKEAYNLMNGRAVNKDLTNKEGQVYNAWMQMDFKQTENSGNYKLKQYHQNYGYDLVSALEKHPIKELTNEQDKTRLVESLQKGNCQSVTFVQNGIEQKHFIEANPQFKTINVYDSNMQRLHSKQGQNEKQGQGENNTAKQVSKNESQKQSAADDSDEMPKASNKRRKKQSNSVS